MTTPDLGALEVRNIVSAMTFEPFCHLFAKDTNGELIAMGQLTPEDTRNLGLTFIECAAAAEIEAGLFQVLNEAGIPEVAQQLIADLRNWRANRDKD